MKKELTELKIDREFRSLIRPLNRQEYLQLEANIMADGCREPIVTWNGFIVDGHNRYEICHKHSIPFATEEIDFETRDEAILWICVNQLGRRNLSEETRKFLIGLQYEKEKIISARRNTLGTNQYSPRKCGRKPVPLSGHSTAIRIAAENHISPGTVQKYARYARALQEIDGNHSNVLPKILAGDYKISHDSVIEMAKLSTPELVKVKRKLDSGEAPFACYSKSRKAINNGSRIQKTDPTISERPSVKDMPSYDPDAELNSLCFTIPSWIGSMERIKGALDMERVSREARHHIKESLEALMRSAETMLKYIKES